MTAARKVSSDCPGPKPDNPDLGPSVFPFASGRRTVIQVVLLFWVPGDMEMVTVPGATGAVAMSDGNSVGPRSEVDSAGPAVRANNCRAHLVRVQEIVN